MKKIKLPFLVVLTFFALKAVGQQDAQFSHYMFNGLNLNPGYAGIEKVMRLNFISRVQWLTYQNMDAPQSNFLSASTPLKNYKVGAGAYLLYETLGPVTNFNFNLSASKHFELNNGLLGIGLNGGVISQKLDPNYKVVHEDDAVYQALRKAGNAQTKPDLNAGIWYEHQKYYAGIGFNHLTRTSFNYGKSAISSQLTNHLYVTAGYRWKPTYTLDVTPSFLVQSDLNQVTYLLGGIAEYNKKFWAGVNVRQSLAKRDQVKGGKTLSNDDVIVYVGINFLKNKQNQDAMRVGYAFDFVTSGVIAKKRTSHEIMISYMIPNLFGSAPPPVRTPRYRHEN